MTYTFDVLRLVPYANLQAGLIQFAGAVVTPQSLFAMRLGSAPTTSSPATSRPGCASSTCSTPADLLSDPLNLGSNPFAFTATARASYLF